MRILAELQKLSNGGIAALALGGTLIAALLALVGSLTVAWVNRGTALKLEREKARRTYRTNALQPVLDYAEKVVLTLEVVTFAMLQNDALYQRAVQDAALELNDLAGIGMLSSTPQLNSAWKAFKKADEKCFEILGEVDKRRATNQRVADLAITFAAQVNETRRTVTALRTEVERYIF